VRAGNYAAAKILLDARGGAVSILNMCVPKSVKFMIISIICYSNSCAFLLTNGIHAPSKALNVLVNKLVACCVVQCSDFQALL